MRRQKARAGSQGAGVLAEGRARGGSGVTSALPSGGVAVNVLLSGVLLPGVLMPRVLLVDAAPGLGLESA